MSIIILDHPFKLPRTYYTAIGEITFLWSFIEFLAHDIIRYHLGMDKKEGRVAFFITNVKEKITLLKTVSNNWVKDKSLKEELFNIAKEIQRLNQERNNIVHGVWGYPKDNHKDYRLLYVTEY